jgi:hypothetical protein
MPTARRNPWSGLEIKLWWGEMYMERPISRPRWEKISPKVLTDPRS